MDVQATINGILDDAVKTFGGEKPLIEHLKVSRQTMYMWRCGKSRPSAEHILTLLQHVKLRWRLEDEFS